MQPAQKLLKLLSENVAKAIVGKEEAIEKVIVSFLCGGHIFFAFSEDKDISLPKLHSDHMKSSFTSANSSSLSAHRFLA